MAENHEKKPFSAKVERFAHRACGSLTRLYDRSAFSGFIKAARVSVLSLSSRVVGVFFLTLGIYAFLISLLMILFSLKTPDYSSLYGGAVCAICSVPLLFSKGNLSSLLSESRVGRVICDYLDIRRDELMKSTFSGHSSIAFVAGVILGAATLFFPFTSVIAALAVIFIAATVFSSPETGLTFMTVSLFVSEIRLQYILLSMTLLSYALKTLRKKRKLSLKRRDIVSLIFALSTLGAVIFSADGRSSASHSGFFITVLMYIACVCLMRDCRKIIKLFTLAIVTCGILASLYIIGFSLDAVIPKGTAAERDYLLTLVSSLPAFREGFTTIVMTAFIPACTAFIIKARSEGYRFTFILCLLAMMLCLLMSGNLAFILVGGAVSALLLIITGSKRVYLALSSVAFLFVALLFAGNFGNRIYRYVYRNILEAYVQARELSESAALGASYSFSGQGFSHELSSSGSFFASIFSYLGVAGAIIFAAFIIFVFIEAAALILRTYRTRDFSAALERYTGMDSLPEMRLCIIALSCALLVIVICSVFFDLYESPLSYLLLFILCGSTVAYSRCGLSEIEKAEGSLILENTDESSSTVISVASKKG